MTNLSPFDVALLGACGVAMTERPRTDMDRNYYVESLLMQNDALKLSFHAEAQAHRDTERELVEAERDRNAWKFTAIGSWVCVGLMVVGWAVTHG